MSVKRKGMAKMPTRAEMTDAKITLLSTILTGNGHPKEGVLHRLSVLETREENQRALIWLALSALVTSAVGFVASAVLLWMDK